MDFIAWIGRLVFFLLALYLALENTATVPLRLSSTIQWPNVPLLAVILVCFLLGVVAGSVALMPRIVRLRRQAVLPERTAELAAQAAAEQALTRAARQGGAAGDLELETRTRR